MLTTSSPTFAGLTVGSLGGLIKGTAGVLSAIDYTPLTDYSSTSTVTGWAAGKTVQIRYRVNDRQHCVYFRITGTSDAATASFTVPVPASSALAFWRGHLAIVVDNTVTQDAPGLCQIASGASTVNLYPTGAAGAWTAAGTKTVSGFIIFEV